MEKIEEKFNNLLWELIGDSGKLCVAVSGGCDSTALLLLAKQYSELHNIQLTALTVDHCLRQNSALEAASVHELCDSLDISHRVLTWNHTAIDDGKIEIEARRARYELLTKECSAIGCKFLLVGHNADEQLETYMMRNAMHSGKSGLACMSGSRVNKNGIVVIRPCLPFFKEQLKEYLINLNIDWHEDEMNSDTKFMRVKYRQDLRAMQIEDKIECLKNVYAYGVQRHEIEKRAADFLKSHDVISKHGFVEIDNETFSNIDISVQRDVLKRLIRCIGRQEYNVSDDICDRLMSCQRSFNCGGVVVTKNRKSTFIYRDLRNSCYEFMLNSNDEIVFDQRFKIKSFIDKLYVTMLGGSRRLLGIPSYVAKTLPVFMVGNNVVHVGYNNDVTLGFLCEFLVTDDLFDVFYPLKVIS